MQQKGYGDIYERFLLSKGVSTDTRRIREGEIFFALKGPNFDANKFAEEALAKGAILAVVDDDKSGSTDERFIQVDNSLAALQWLAETYRREFDIPVVGLTGSNGKTTTKELIHAVLSTELNAFATPGNLNNHIGVPLSILQMPRDLDIAVIEMGANHIGEITRLCEISQPTHGIITNVGKDHLEGFGSFEGSLRANSELFQYLLANGGGIFVNSSDAVLDNMSKRFKDPIKYPEANDFSRTRMIDADPFVRYESESGHEVQTKLVGKYNFDNIATALCIGKFFSIPEMSANEAIGEYQAFNNRSEWRKTDNNSIFLDAYNANPSSMQVALESFSELKGDKAVILGDMFELGEHSRKEHEDLGKLLESSDFKKVILCGKEMAYASSKVAGSHYFPGKEDLLNYLQNNPLRNYLVMLKGSRGMAMEDCLPFL